jgi:predicted transposase YdaD
MPQQFDATLKDLVQAHPADWVALLGGSVAGPIEVLTPDLSTVSAFADVVLRLPGGVLHLDFQSGPDPDVASRMLLYNVLAHRHFEEPVLTVLVLLRPKADRSDLTGTLRYELWPGRGGLEFRFQVIRLWEVPVETLLGGGLGVAPLALLGKFPGGVAPAEALPSVIERLAQRIETEAPAEEQGTLLTASFILTGLRLDYEQAKQLFKGVFAMRDSSTYQGILDEGRAEGMDRGRVQEARAIILRLGRKRFQPPTEAVESTLQAISDIERLDRIIDRLDDAADWQDLLATP